MLDFYLECSSLLCFLLGFQEVISIHALPLVIWLEMSSKESLIEFLDFYTLLLRLLEHNLEDFLHIQHKLEEISISNYLLYLETTFNKWLLKCLDPSSLSLCTYLQLRKKQNSQKTPQFKQLYWQAHILEPWCWPVQSWRYSKQVLSTQQ